MESAHELRLLATPHMIAVTESVFTELKQLGNGVGNHIIPIPVRRFPNGEVEPQIGGSIRHSDTYLFHSMWQPDINVNELYMQLLLSLDAAVRGSVHELNLVLPHISYERQDRKAQGRVPISATLLGRLLRLFPQVKHIITLDLHSDQQQGFFDCPLDNLSAHLLFGEYFYRQFHGDFNNVVICAPDAGSGKRSNELADDLHKSSKDGYHPRVIIFEKERYKTGHGIKRGNFPFKGTLPVGSVGIVYDDIFDSGDTAISAARALFENGASKVYIAVSHFIAVPKPGNPMSAEQKLSELAKMGDLHVVVTDSIPRTEEYYASHPWLRVISTAKLFAHIIRESNRIDGSVSSLFRTAPHERSFLSSQKTNLLLQR